MTSGAARGWAKYFALLCLFGLILSDGTSRLLSAPAGYAVRFDGLDDRVTFGAAPALGVTTFTLETWFRRDGPGSTATTGSGGVVAVPLVTKGMSESEGNNKDTNYFFGIDGKRRVLAADFEDTINGGNHPVYGVTPICDGVWYHAAVTYDGTTWRLYLNGVLETQLVAGNFTPRFDSIQQAAIGTALNSNGSASGAFQGAMDEVRIWNVARSAADIQTSMPGAISNAPGLIGRWGLDEGNGTPTVDSSGSGVTGMLRNGAAWITGSPFAPTPLTPGDYAVHLKGTTGAADYVSFETTPLGATSFTVETWFKRDGTGVTTTTGTGGLAAVVPLVTKGRNEGEGNATDVNYFLGLSGNVIAADFEEGAGATNPGLNHPVTGVTQIQNDVWYHAAVTYNGSAVQLYLNGALEATAVASGPPRYDSIAHAAIGTALNSTGTAAGFFAGSLDEVRIWTYARTAAQIASGRNREIPAANGLIGRWSFDECCGAATDSSGQVANGTMYGSSWTWVAGGPLPGAANIAPVASAGPDQTLVLPATAQLAGSVTDDGLSGAAATVTWTQTSGPATVTFGNPTALSTTATFPVTGAYVLTLTATDGELTASDSISIQVNPGAPNLPPVVNAGPDKVVLPLAPASLDGVVTDDGHPGGDPTTTWSKLTGPGAVTFAQPNETVTTATFGTSGAYVLMLTANDGALSSSDTVNVTVTAAAPVNKAIDFGGTNAYVTFGPAPGLGAAAFTLEAWFRRDGAGATTTTGSGGVTAVPLVTKGRSENDGSNVDMNYFLGIRSDNVLTADFEEGAGGASPGLNHPIAGVTVIQNNVWYHAAATYDGTKWQLFLNGVLERELTVGRPPRADSIQHAAIGTALNSTGAASGFFDGVIDEVRIWGVARSAQQIADGMTGEILSAPNLLGRWGLNDAAGVIAADSSGHAIAGTVIGTNWSWATGAPFNITVNAAPNQPTLIGPAQGSAVSSPAQLNVSVSDNDGDPTTVTFYGRPKTIVAPDFTYVTIPDTQHYVDSANYPTFTAQTNWIVANRTALNIPFVSQLGDLTEHLDAVPLEWSRADTSMRVLDDNGVPYGTAPGNHDQSATGVAAYFDLTFPPTRFLGQPWYLGYLGANNGEINRLNKDNYEEFSVGELKFLVIHVELDWPSYAVAWADQVIKSHPNHRVILSSHAFLDTTNTRPTSPQFRADGTSAEAVWQQIVKPNCNVFMVVNGHYPGEGRRTDLNDCGKPVHQVLMDYQSRANGGDGWLRYFVFKPSENKIYAYTYSPTRNGGAGEFENDATSQFVLDYDMQGAPFTVIGTNTNVSSGSTTSATWSGLLQGGEYEWYVEVNDGKATTTGPIWSFSASAATNTPPVAGGDFFSLNEDSALTVPSPGVLANDTDVDDNSLTAVLVQGPSHGTVALAPDGHFTYTPAANFSGSDSFTYRASDGTAQSGVATVTLLVAGVNDAPVAANDASTTAEDTPISIAVLANDSDADGDTLIVSGVGMPTHGTATVNGSAVTYTPAINYSGADSFTYTVSDGHGGSATAMVSVTVGAANDTPVAVNDTATTAEDTPVPIAVLANDSDVDGDTLTVNGVGTPAHGTATVSGSTVTYTPALNYSGPDSFTYTVSDGRGGTATATVSVTIGAANDAPAAVNDTATTDEDTAVSIAVLANDSDVDGDTLTVSGIGTPMHGTATTDGSMVMYTPPLNYYGVDTFLYTIADGHGGTATATVAVAIIPANDAPVAMNDAAATAEDTGVSIAVLANDSDVDGDALTVSVASTPAHGNAFANADGTITYTPAANYNGADSFTYTIADGDGGIATATVSVTIGAVNDAPSAANDAATTVEDTAVSITVLGNDSDPDVDTLTVSVAGTPAHGSAVANANGTITYTPAPNYNGADSFTYTIGDGHGGTATATVSVTISAVNDAPAAVNDTATTTEDTAVSITVLGNDSDPDGDTLTVSVAGTPAHGSALANANGTITYTPAPNYNGADSFSYTIGDGHGGTATATVSVTIGAANDAPAAVNDAATTTEDTAVSIAVLTNDSDPDGDPLTVSATTAPAHGTATVNGTAVTYTPALNYNGADSFTYTIGDGQGGTATASVSVTIGAANDAPAAVNDAATTTEDTAVSIAVLTNDSDPDGDPLTVSATTAPAHGTATVNGTAVTYTPALNYNGADSFTYTIGDGQGGTATASVSVTIGAVNDAPAAANDTATTAEDTAVTVSVLANDTDVDGDTLTIASVGVPAHGTTAIVGNSARYTPAADYNGPDTFTYTISDGHAGTATGTVNVTVTPVNDIPFANDDFATTNEDVPVTIPVVANDIETDGDTLTVTLDDLPTHGTAAVAGNTVVYTPAVNYSGPDKFGYRIDDGHGGTDTAPIFVTVNSVNDAPAAVNDAATTAEDTARTIAVLANDSDADGDTLTVIAATAPSHGTAVVNANGTVGYTPAANYNGPDTFTYTVSDGHGGTATGTVTITVTAVNDVPAAVNDVATTAEDTAVSITVLTNDSDADGDTLTVSGASAPAYGSALINANGTITYTPATNYNGADSFTYTITDGHGGTATASVALTITAENDAPAAANDAATTAEDTTVSIAVLGNDSDADGDTLTVSIASGPAHGSALANADGTISYTPAANYNGADSFSYAISDGHGGTATASVALTVSAENDAPLAVSDNAMTTEDATVSIAVLTNDSDADGDTLTVSGVGTPAHGGAVINPDGTVAYTPAANYNGADSVTYTIADSHGGTATASVALTITAENDEPAAANDAATTAEDTVVSIAVLSNDSDADGDTLTVSIASQPAHGSALANADGTISYTPAANYNGADSFSYAISDGHGGTATASVALTVSAENDAPLAVSDNAMTTEDATVSIAVLTNDSDADGDTLTVSGVGTPAHGGAVINPDGTVAYTPAANYNGADSFTYTIADGHGGTATASVALTITAENDEPAAANDAATTAEDTVVSIAVLSNDSDADGDTLTVSIASQPAHGSALANADGTISYTPAANYNGADSFSYAISDGHGGTATASVALTVSAENDAPLAVSDNAMTTEDATVSIAVLTNDSDADGDTLTVSGVGTPAHGGAVINPDGTVAYTPAANYNGADSVTYTIADGHGGTATASVALTITAENDAPVAANDAATAAEDTAVSIAVLSNDSDADGDTLTVSIASGPAHGSALANADGTISYTPAANYNGADSFSYAISDGHGGTATASVALTVSAENDAPLAVSDNAMTTEDATVSIAVLTNDSDADGDTLTVSGVGTPAHGGAVINPDGTVAYTPAANYNGADSVTYTIADGHGGTATASVALTITAENDAPVAANDAATAAEDTAVSIAVLSNDSDADGDTLTVSIASGPAHGSALANADGTISYTPAPNYNGADSFSYAINDGHGGTATASVALTVSAENDPPAAANDAATTAEDTAVSIAVLTNDSDADGDTLTVSGVGTPAHGGAVINPDGTVAYTPAANYNGADSVTYTIADGHGGTATASVALTITAENDAPVAANDAATAAEDTAVSIAVLSNDSDADGDTLTVSIASGPAHGSALANADGTISYTPAANYNGADSFSYAISDGHGGTATASVALTVSAENDAPLAVSDNAMTTEDATVSIAVLTNDSDADGDTLTVSGVGTPAHGGAVINPDGTVAYTPAANYNGADSFTYTIADGHGGTATASVALTISAENDAPAAANDAATTTEDTAVSIVVLTNDSDADGDTLTVSLASQPAHGSALANADGTISYTPAANYNGADSFTYGVADGHGGGATASVTVTITAENDMPAAANDTAATAEDTAVSIAVLSNDSDPDGDTLTVSVASSPAHGSALANADGTIAYTPLANYSGGDSFTYAIDDGHGGTATASVALTVTAENDAPAAANDAATTAEDTAVSIVVLTNDSDADGDTLTVSLASQPAHGSAMANADGTISYTPAANYNGVDSFTYTIDDGHGGSATASVIVTITAENDAPAAANDTAATAEDTAVSIAVLSNDSDPDGDTLTVSVASSPAHGSALANADGTIAYTPAANYSGSDSFTYTIADGHGGTATASVALTITAENDAPAATNDAATTAEDTAVSIVVLTNDSDADGDALTMSGVSTPAHGSAMANADGTITYTPAPNYNGVDSFTYTIDDGHGGSATASVIVTITAENDAPAAANDTAATAEDTAVSIAVLSNDSDPDGDTLTVSVASSPAHGSALANADGTIAYTPAANYNGADSFSYTIDDGHGGTTTASVALTITAENDAPAATSDTATAAEDTTVTIVVLTNDSDADGDMLTVSIASTPAHGSATVNTDGSVAYTPAPNYNGPDSFTYAIDDGHGGTSNATVALTVTAENDAPAAANDVATTAEDTAVSIVVLTNDSDAESDTLTVSLAGTPVHGSALANADGTIRYTPAANYNGADSFTYTIADGHGATATASVALTVTAVNDTPVAVNDTATTREGVAVAIPVLANDSDVDGDSLSIINVGAVAHGSADIGPNGEIIYYAPEARYFGTDTVIYTVSDGHGGTATATVSITVTSVNEPPVAVDDVAATPEDTPAWVEVLSNDHDPDSDPLSIVSVAAPAHGTAIFESDTITYIPAANYNGADSFTYMVRDEDGVTATGTVHVTVTPVNDAPAAVADTAMTPEDAAVNIAVLANDTDADGDTLLVTGVSAPEHGEAVVNANGTITYTPAANYNGTDSFAYTVSDGASAGVTATVSVSVNPVNDVPAAAVDAATTPEDTSVTIPVLANDSDPDGDSLSVTGVTQPALGSAIVNAGGAVTYTPNANASGTDSFSYTVSDGHGGNATTAVTVTITAVNDPPAAHDDAATIAEDTAASIPVLANDSDADGDSISLIGVGAAAHGSTAVNADGTITYTPASNYAGVDSFSYTVSDGHGDTATATVSVTTTAENDAPVAVADTATTSEDTAVSIAVLANDSDVDGDILSVTDVSTPAHGSAAANADGTITYTPAANYDGTDGFTYTIGDGHGGTATTTVSVTTTAENDAPTAANDTATTAEDTAVSIAVLANDSDMDGDTLTVSAAGAAAHGTAMANADGTITYSPAANFNGVDTFTYTISDSHGGTAAASVSVTVAAENDAPAAANDAAATTEDSAVSIAVLANDTDADGDQLTVSIAIAPAHGSTTVNADGTITYTPAANYAGADSFSYAISDGHGETAAASVSVTIAAENDAPAAANDAAATAEDTAVSIAVLSNDSDTDGDTLAVSIASQPAHGSAVANGDGTIAYMPAANYNGADSFTYAIADGHGGNATATVALTITAENDAPEAANDVTATAEDTVVAIAVLSNDSDPDGDTLSVSVASQPAHGNAVANADGTVSYTPVANYNGADSFSYAISDGHGETAAASVSVTIAAENDAPAAANDAAATAEDTAVSIAVLSNDSDTDGDTLAVSIASQPAHGSAVANGDGTIAYMPAANYNGADSFTYAINDGHGGSATATVALTITAENDAPEAANDVTATAEDTVVAIAVLSNDSDPDGDTLSVSVASQPAHGNAVANADGTVSYTPVANYNGADSFSYAISDGHGETAAASVSVTIAAENDAPAAANDAAATAEDTAVSIAVLSNDSDTDGDTLAVSIASQPAHGSAVANGDGTIAYMPAANYNGADSFTYAINDGHGGSATATVALTISAENDPPAAHDDAATIAEDTATSIPVLANDSDPDGDSISLIGVGAAAHGSTAVNADGTITYTPASNYAGVDSFTYTVSDGHGDTATATVSITTTAENDAPVAVADTASTSEDTAVSIAVLANDSDADGDMLSVSVSTPAHGSAAANADGTITYTPAPNYAGPDSVTYTIADGHGGSATATVSLNVIDVNDPPLAADDVATTMEDTAVDVVVLANDSDPDGDTLSLAGVSPAAHGTVVVNADGTIHYTPAPDDDAADSFTYTITDGHGASATATVHLTVAAVDDDPVASDDAATTTEDTAVVIAVLSNDHDPDSAVLSLAGVSTPAHGTALIGANGTISYAPQANFDGTDAFTYTLEDGGGHSATAHVSVTVTAVNDGPAALGDAATTAEDTALTISVLANDTDVDGGSLSISAVDSPGHGTALANEDGTVTYTPAANYAGADSFIYTVSDGQGGTATASVSVTVTAVNDAPVAAADSYTTAEDTTLTIAAPGVQNNDADVDGDSLASVLVQGPTHGTLTLNAGGGFTYTPAPNVSGTDTFTYKVNDGSADSAPVVVTIAVQSVNHAPAAATQSLIVRQNVALPIVLAATDADGDALSYHVSTNPAYGTLSGTAPNLLYTPNAGYVGIDAFTFVADDGTVNSAPAAVQLQVKPPSRPPEAEDQWVMLDEDSSSDITLNAGDPEGDPLTFTIVMPPSHGRLSGTAPNLTYTPDPDYFGDDRFVFRASDGVNDSNDAAVDLWISGVNDPPVVSNLSFTVAPDGSVTNQLQAVDPDGDWIFYWVTVDPTFGTVTFDPFTGEFTYVPNPDNPGYDTFTYTVFDWETMGNDGTVEITLDSLPPPTP